MKTAIAKLNATESHELLMESGTAKLSPKEAWDGKKINFRRIPASKVKPLVGKAEIELLQTKLHRTLQNDRSESTPAKLPRCPFCMKADMIQELWWAWEAFDGSEHESPALRCNRCNAIAPKPVWESAGSASKDTKPAPNKGAGQ